MKKTIALPLIAAIAFGAAACSKTEADNTANTEASADLNAAATDAIADVNAATENATENSLDAAGNASALDANATETNASNAM